MFNITTLLKQGFLIVRIEGELDMHSASQFRQIVDEAVDASSVKNVIINFQKATFVDSSGLGVILGRFKKITMLGGQLVAVHVNASIARIFELSGLYKIIKLYNNERDALTQL